jgi:hypothetical protein
MPEFALTTLPAGSRLRSVSADPARVAGRDALRVSLTDEVSAGTYGVDFVDMPTFVILPVAFENGRISVDICSRLRADAPDFARAFAGLAYRIADNGEQFESVYLRPLNGTGLNPPPPRDKRAIQYFAYPDWKFDRLRDAHPDAYESGADIAPDIWINLTVDIRGTRLTASVDGAPVLDLAETKAAPRRGAIGLWVDIGTEAFFSNLRVTQSD